MFPPENASNLKVSAIWLAPDGSTKNQQAGPNQQPPEGATGNLLNSRSGDHPQSSMHPSLEQSLGT
jgi:hypothetical protein